PSTSPAAACSDRSSSAATLPRRPENSCASPVTSTAGWAGAALSISCSLSGALTDILLPSRELPYRFAGSAPGVPFGPEALSQPACPRAPLEDETESTDRLGVDLRPPRDHVHELLELLRGPAFEHAVAVGLVGLHHRVAVVPVQTRLGIEPEGAPGAVRDVPENARMRLAAVRARVAQHDHGRAGVEVVPGALEELAPHAAVVRIARDVRDARLAGDPLRHRAK